MTLTHALYPSMSRRARMAAAVALALGGSLFIALAAQIAVPMVPVPMTLQTLAVLIVGLTYGARLGASTLLLYLVEGAAGLPVFANGASGLPYMLGPTGGFLAGFVAIAWLAGLAADRGLAKGLVSRALVALAVSALLYTPGLVWPAALMDVSWSELLSGWMLPFLPGDAIKAVLAALAVSGGWAAIRRL